MNAETYECDGCGACCSGAFPIYAAESDGQREPRVVAETQRLAPQLATPRWTFRLFPLPFHETCCFLTAERRCDIYATRPEVCREFPAGGTQCQDARRRMRLPKLAALATSDVAKAASFGAGPGDKTTSSRP